MSLAASVNLSGGTYPGVPTSEAASDSSTSRPGSERTGLGA